MVSLKNFNAPEFSRFLKELVVSRHTTMRHASLQAGLDHGAVGRFTRGRRPSRDSCLLMAEVFEVDPNEMLARAGYDPMPIVDRTLIDPGEFPPDVKAFATQMMALEPERRREIFNAVKTLLKAELG